MSPDSDLHSSARNAVQQPTRREASDMFVFVDVADETVVYDVAAHMIHSLNPTARRVWDWSDGKTSVESMAKRLSSELGVSKGQAESLVWLAIDRLEGADVFESEIERPPGISRRRVLQMGLAASLLPVVHSIVAPHIADAQSSGCATCGCISQGCSPGRFACINAMGNCVCANSPVDPQCVMFCEGPCTPL